MIKAEIIGIEEYFPQKTLTNEELCLHSAKYTPDKIYLKTGIKSRQIADKGQTAGDLAFEAAKKLLCGKDVLRSIDFVLFCTQSSDYFLPTTACIIQDRLGLPQSCGALDYNLGCSGYVYGLSLAKGLIESGQVRNLLLLTGETYSKYLDEDDVSSRVIFGDAGTATLITAVESLEDRIGGFEFGTNGSGADRLIVRNGASRYQRDGSKNDFLYMNGPAIFDFTIEVVPELVRKISEKFGNTIDYWVFHQANSFILKYLREKIGIEQERFYLNVENTGNTVSSSIPIALKNVIENKLNGMELNVGIVGFGVGLSWAGAVVKIK